MILLRCAACGQNTPHREGVRFCSACGAALGLSACPSCGRDAFWGDRHCACCGLGLSEASAEAPSMPPRPAPWAPTPAPLQQPLAAGAVPLPAAPPALLDDFQSLIQEARSRAHAAEEQPLAPGKAHLTQDDIDRLFGVDG